MSFFRRRNLLVAICAFSAGVHLAITPEHLSESPPLGVSFIVASSALVVVAGGLLFRPASSWPPLAAAALFAGMIGAYAATRATAIPGIPETPEAVDVVGVITKVVEIAGLLLAASLLLPRLRPSAAQRWMPTTRSSVHRIGRTA